MNNVTKRLLQKRNKLSSTESVQTFVLLLPLCRARVEQCWRQIWSQDSAESGPDWHFQPLRELTGRQQAAGLKLPLRQRKELQVVLGSAV